MFPVLKLVIGIKILTHSDNNSGLGISSLTIQIDATK